MTICLNGKDKSVPEGTTLEGMLDLLKLKKKSIVIELNQRVISSDAFESTHLNDRDTLEIVHFVGGG
jgi:sulfur carrier protein